ALVEPCIKAGTSEKGVCPECGAPWERVVERVGSKPYRTGKSAEKASVGLVTAFSGYEDGSSSPTFNTLGWRPTCDHCRICDHYNLLHDDKPCEPYEPIPATIFDPFVGSGTTLQVARALGRSGVGLDLSLEYLHLARQRLSLDALDAWGKGKKDSATVTDLPMFDNLRRGNDEKNL
ncbi:MAG: hypothetical protein IMY80_07630, partial [Chloroflexi bacterium]|nr:hypothetical protein [Chloroflexota bacterium]